VPLPSILQDLRLPLIGAPLFIVSNPHLVIAQCRAGIVGAFPALNARAPGELEQWLQQIQTALAEPQPASSAHKTAPYAVNQIVHPSNARLQEDVELCVKYKAPIMITSLQSPGPVVKAAHSYGGIVFHDVISIRHAEKALADGVDGLILVTSGAGGHAGTLNPFAFVEEIRRFYNGPVILSGSMSRGHHTVHA
jgi:nitronate monooxygenase